MLQLPHILPYIMFIKSLPDGRVFEYDSKYTKQQHIQSLFFSYRLSHHESHYLSLRNWNNCVSSGDNASYTTQIRAGVGFRLNIDHVGQSINH